MIEVSPNLWVGSWLDAELVFAQPLWQAEWFVISAAKEPWHRDALGYTGRGAPKDHPEYLVAERPGRLILNLVDVEDVSYINPVMIDKALEAISDRQPHRRVLVHCNQGQSRSPTIAMLWMWREGLLSMDDEPHDVVVGDFKALYPLYAPAGGMDTYAKLVIEGRA